MVKVVVAGVGTIGKRVAGAVKKQDDMELYGVADVSQTGGLRTVLSEDGPLHGTHLYASNKEGKENLEDSGFYVEGLLEHQLDEVDVVVDCTPPGVDEANKENMYEPHDVKAVFQGGAPDDIADVTEWDWTTLVTLAVVLLLVALPLSLGWVRGRGAAFGVSPRRNVSDRGSSIPPSPSAGASR